MFVDTRIEKIEKILMGKIEEYCKQIKRAYNKLRGYDLGLYGDEALFYLFRECDGLRYLTANKRFNNYKPVVQPTLIKNSEEDSTITVDYTKLTSDDKNNPPKISSKYILTKTGHIMQIYPDTKNTKIENKVKFELDCISNQLDKVKKDDRLIMWSMFAYNRLRAIGIPEDDTRNNEVIKLFDNISGYLNIINDKKPTVNQTLNVSKLADPKTLFNQYLKNIGYEKKSWISSLFTKKDPIVSRVDKIIQKLIIKIKNIS